MRSGDRGRLTLAPPRWTTHPSWVHQTPLWLPTTRPEAPSGDQPPAPLATGQLVVFIDEDDLGLDHSTLEDISSLVVQIPAEPAIGLVAKLSALTGSLGRGHMHQLEIAKTFFDNAPITDVFAAIVRRDSQRRVFSDQQLQLLTWLLLEHGQEATFESEFSAHHHELLRRALLGCATVISDAARYLEDAEPSEALAYTVQLSALYVTEGPLPAIARFQQLLALAGDEESQRHPQFLNIEELHREAYELSPAEQFRLGLDLAASCQIFTRGDQRMYVPPAHVEAALRKVGVADRSERALALIGASRTKMLNERVSRSASGSDAPPIWEPTVFKRFPFLLCPNGGMMLLSPAFLQAWLSDGFHYRLLSAAQRRDGGKPGAVSARLQTFTGAVMERYCVELLNAVHKRGPFGAARVLREHPYRAPQLGRGRGSLTSDIAVDIGPDLVLIEVTSSRLRLHTLVGGGVSATQRDLERTIGAKIRQLDRCVTALLSGNAELPGVEMTSVRRIWPVLVSAGVTIQTPALWDAISQMCPATLAQPAVQHLTLLNLEEYEMLCGLVERGHTLPDMLDLKTKPRYAQRELSYWLLEDPRAPETRVPRLLRDRFNEALSAAVARLVEPSDGAALEASL